jgi:hypothetical protein
MKETENDLRGTDCFRQFKAEPAVGRRAAKRDGH